MDYSTLTVKDLKYASQSWDRRTKKILLCVAGSGNMFGGFSRMLHITLLGENAYAGDRVGECVVEGVVTSGYNIDRGGKGEDSASATYYKGASNFDNLQIKTKTFNVQVDGSCGGAEEALLTILSATKDFIILS